MSEQEQSPIMIKEEEEAATQEQLGAPPMQKKKHKKRNASKGRLKKLWRRATTPSQSKGITSRKEWIEMQELHSDWKSSHLNNVDVSDPMMGSLPGPSVILSKERTQCGFTNIDNWQATEGSDHRDIIMNLLFRQSSLDGGGDGIQKKKKRKLGAVSAREPIRQSSLINVPTLPAWSNVRNLSGMGGLAVIEISIEDCDPGSTCPLMPSERIKEVKEDTNSSWTSLFDNSNGGANDSDSKVQRSITACKVKLFQGNHPRCLSDVLMFLPPPVAQSEHDTKKQSGDNMIDAIYDLRLTPKQMRSEGYPIITGQEDSSIDSSKESVESKIDTYNKINVQDINTDIALDLVTALAVKVSFGDDNMEDANNNEHAESDYYVKTFSRTKEASPRRPKIFSIDCEMVQTKAGKELARVSVIEFVGADEEKSILVLDELVKPRRGILDYLTRE